MNIQSFEESYSVMMDPEVRQMLRENPAAAVRELESRGHALFNPDDFSEIKVVTGARGTMYVPLPRIEADYALSSDELDRIHAGGVVGTVGTASTASSLSTVTTTFSSASSAGSMGTAGSS